jgi:hypothetical protein
LAKVLAAGVFDQVDAFEVTEQADFNFGLQLYLNGVAGFIDRA